MKTALTGAALRRCPYSDAAWPVSGGDAVTRGATNHASTIWQDQVVPGTPCPPFRQTPPGEHQTYLLTHASGGRALGAIHSVACLPTCKDGVGSRSRRQMTVA